MCASCRTSTPRSSGRRSSCTRRGTPGRSPSSRTTSSRSSPRRGGGGARRCPSGYLHALVNEGREAGSSLPHTHSQLVWLPEPPAETQHERRSRAVDRRGRARRPRARVPVGEPSRLRARDRAGRAAREARSATSCCPRRSRFSATRRAACTALPAPSRSTRGSTTQRTGTSRSSRASRFSPASSSAPAGGSTPSRPRTQPRRCASSGSTAPSARGWRSLRGTAEPPRLRRRG